MELIFSSLVAVRPLFQGNQLAFCHAVLARLLTPPIDQFVVVVLDSRRYSILAMPIMRLLTACTAASARGSRPDPDM